MRLRKRRKRRHKTAEAQLYDLDLKMTREALKLARKRKTRYIA